MSSIQDKMTPEFKARFLQELANNDGHVSVTCRAMNVTHACMYKHRNSDVHFKEAWDDIVQIAIDTLEQEAYRRAHKGENKAVYYQGNVVGTENNKSDQLLIWYINNKKGYAQKQDHRIGGLPGAPPLNSQFQFYPENFTPEQLEQFTNLLEIAQTKPVELAQQKLLASAPATTTPVTLSDLEIPEPVLLPQSES